MFSRDYLAGILDGEGCIFVHQHRWNPSRRLTFAMRVTINMTDKTFIHALAELLDANVLHHKRSEKNPKHRDCYEVVLSGKKAMEFLEWVEPVLVIKKRQAQLAIEFQKDMLSTKSQMVSRSLTEAQHQEIFCRRDYLRLQIKELKRFDSSVMNVGEFGGSLEQTIPSQAEGDMSSGVCNEHGPTAKAKMCSDLRRDAESAAEMTAPHLKMVK